MADTSVRSVSTLDDRETIQNIEYEIYNDLKEKHEALAQQFMTIQLEKEELVEEMKRMQQQNAELKELEKYEHEEIEQFEQFTQPLFQGSIATMSAALDNADLLKKNISAQKDEYKELNNKLKQEIDSLKAENKKYQSALQDMTINQQKKEKEHKHKIELSQAEIQDINIEQQDIYEKYRQLENEYNILKQETSQQLQSQMEATTPNADVGAVISDQKTQHISFVKSTNKLFDSKANLNISYYMRTPYASEQKLQIVEYESTQSLPGFDNYDSNECGKIDENAEIEAKKEESDNNRDKRKELEDVILSMANSIKQKEIAIEALKLKMDKKDGTVKQLTKQIAELSRKNSALSKNSNACFEFNWFQ